MRVVRSGQKKVVDGGELLVLAPSGDFSLKRSPENNSLVVRLAWRNQSFLWGGAMQIAEETALLDRVSELKTDWLRIPGGAGKDTNSAEFLEAISPHIAVLSIGENKQGQPYPATLQRIQATGARLLRTEPGGNNLTFTADGETIEIRP
jgi:competence protein ComEC